MMRWPLFIIKLPFWLAYFLLYALYFVFWYLLNVIGHVVTLGLVLVVLVIAAFQGNGTSGQLLMAIAAWAAINRLCALLARSLPRPGSRPSITMPLSPK